MTIELGDKVKCRVTGFSGIVISKTVHLNGCDRFHVQPACGKDGKYPDGWNIDEHSLDIIKKGAGLPKKEAREKELQKAKAARPGGHATKAERY